VIAPAATVRLSAVAALAAALFLGGCAHLVVLHDPLTASEHNDLGVAYESSGQIELASREYRKSLSLDSHQSFVRVNLGNLDAARGRWSSAEKFYRRALRDSSTNADAMNNLAVSLLRQSRHRDEARTLAARAVVAGGERESLYRETFEEASGSGN
jgi:Flp pilus assembly protein TadD